MLTDVEVALSLQRQGRSTEAEHAYRRGLSEDVPSPSIAAAAYNNLAGLLHGRRAYDEAISNWEASIKTLPTFADGHGNMATALLQQGQMRSAWRVLRRAVMLAPNSAMLYTRLGSVLAAGDGGGGPSLARARQASRLNVVG